MEKEFVPYELAVKLKTLGFDEPCLAYYQKSAVIGDDTILPIQIRDQVSNFNDDEYSKLGVPFWSAPTFSQAFRWFGEKYNLYHTIDKQGYWFFEIKKDEGFGDLTTVIVAYGYNSDEEAELACLDKLIEIVESLARVEHGVYR